MNKRRTTLIVLTLFAAAFALSVMSCVVCAAGYKTDNFTVSAPTPELAKEIGDSAEEWRKTLALFWLEKELPKWSKPCPITVRVGEHLGSGGATSFVFDGGEVFDWRMKIQGSHERLLDSVLPHEVCHTIFASHFRRPLPRWADEGACSIMEGRVEQAKYERSIVTCLKTGRGISFSEMFAMTEYPRDTMPLYAQGHSVCSYLVERSSPQKFLEFLADGMDSDWPAAVKKHYEFDSLLDLQNAWLEWVKRGRPQFVTANYGGSRCVGGRCWRPGYGWIIRSPIVPNYQQQPQIVRPAPSQPPSTFQPVPAPLVDVKPIPAPNANVPKAQEDEGLKSLLVLLNQNIASLSVKVSKIDKCECERADFTEVNNRLTQINQSVEALSIKQSAPVQPAAPAEPQISYYDIVPRKKP